MKYNYEALDEQSFQKFAQALILAEHPGTQCLPVDQPDGGRDAFFLHPEPDTAGFVVFQVKYSRHPGDKDERIVVESTIKSEKTKVEQLIERGATHYYLITNVQGTAHLDVGSIDKANAALAKAFGINSQIWWRDDLDGRLDNALDVKWSYPEVLRASDLLPLLLKQIDDQDDLQSARTLKSYMATQFESDRDIKFKQVDLKRALTELFVDLPLGQKRPQDDRVRRQRGLRLAAPGNLDAYLSQLDISEDYDLEEAHPFYSSGLAGAFLLQMPLVVGVSRFVLEGAPGQGKSTVTQFICQVNRLRILNKEDELRNVNDEHKHGPLRAPFRVDLRDYAAWVTGRHPFAMKDEAWVPEEGRRSLESFLAMQVTWRSGTLPITEDDLLQFLERSHSVIVLDGFDEVADIATRTRLVEEICSASARLDTHARSLQLIVTSRPAAFANSPGFPEDDWVHLELKDLRHHHIEAYKNKWIEVQRLNQQERDMVSSTLEDKLQQPHLRDLARNPMQLAILLHLIHVQGPALPEKRTTLYEEYMKLFFNREAEKSTIVRDHRDLLLSIHGVLAWVLQTQAEEGSGSGSISKDALNTQIRDFLTTEEYDPDLASALLTGTSERVGALVSRVEGTFEFEVQPLREYFAARHLYKTSPYSPPGQAQKGTRPDRFDALARSPYWTNVTRFFCGFYDVGELGTLVDGLVHLGEEDGYRLINQPRLLAMMLLADQVFAQSPRAMKRLIGYVTQEPAFERLTAPVTPQPSLGMGLPETSGREILFEACATKLKNEVNFARQHFLRKVMAENADLGKLKLIWKQRFEDRLMKCDSLQEALDFRVVGHFDLNEIETLTKDDTDLRLRWLLHTGNYAAITLDPILYDVARTAFFDGNMVFPNRHSFRGESMTHLEVLTELLRIHTLADLFSAPPEGIAAHRILLFDLGHLYLDLLEQDKLKGGDGDADPLQPITQFIVDHLKTDIVEWQTRLSLWSTLVNKGFEIAPGSLVFTQIAALSTAAKAKKNECVWHPDGFTSTKGLVERLHFATQKAGDAAWWRLQLADTTGDCAVLCLAVLLSWGKPDILTELKQAINPMVDALDEKDWSRLWSFVTCIAQAAHSCRPGLTEAWFDEAGVISSRVALVLIDRVEDESTQQRLSRRVFADYVDTDPRILRHAADYELIDSTPRDVDWDFVNHLSKLAKESSLPILFSVRRSHDWNVPETLAEAVLTNCESHCSQWIAICERAYSMHIAEKMAKVSAVSERDDWFALHPG